MWTALTVPPEALFWAASAAWKNEEEETNVYVLTEADREKFQEYLITSLYELA